MKAGETKGTVPHILNTGTW